MVAFSRHDDARGWGGRGSWVEGARVFTSVAMRLGSEARKRFGLTMALGLWGCGLWCRRTRGGVAGPRPLEHEAQPHQDDQYQLVKKEMGDHGKTPHTRAAMRAFYPVFRP